MSPFLWALIICIVCCIISVATNAKFSFKIGKIPQSADEGEAEDKYEQQLQGYY